MLPIAPEGIELPAFVGRYRVGRYLGRGSFAVVALAWDEELDSAVAIKILHLRNQETENRFLKEARMLRRVQSLNVISVHDIGRLPDGAPYFVIDYATHGTLEERLAAGIAGQVLVTDLRLQLLSFVDGVADGLTAIHRAGMVHRDIKPANILFNGRRAIAFESECNKSLPLFNHDSQQSDSFLLSTDERVLVSDLGIAKDLSQIDEKTTLLGGTPFYVAPEQRSADHTVTPAADTYSATAIMWRALANEIPPSCGEVESRLQTLPPILVEQGWSVFFKKGLSASVEHRFQSADEWRWAIHDVLGTGSPTLVHQSGSSTVGVDANLQSDVCPYKGLAAYEEGDSRFFRGRDALIDQLCRRLQLESVLVVGGPSGSGKSSLVRAGLVPALKAGMLPGSEHWQCLLMTPGYDPVKALQLCLLPVGGLENILGKVDSKNSQAENLILIIDQFEEIFTTAELEKKDQFLELLADITASAYSTVKLIVVVRADFYGECASEPWLAARISVNQVLVGPMTTSELQQAITEPAREAGYFMESELVSAIVHDAGSENGSLPLVAHALVETWVRRRDNTLTLDGFHASGGVAGAISQTADVTYEHKLDDDGRDATRRLMLKLVNPGHGTPDTRRVLAQEDVRTLSSHYSSQSVVTDVVKKLTDARLLTVDDNKVQIAHEALLRNWPRLKQWIDESRDQLRMRQRINMQAQEWQNEGQETDLLYHGTPLLSALEWRSQNPDQPGTLENLFLDQSEQRQTRLQESQLHRKVQTRRLWTAVIIVLTLLALGAAIASILAYQAFRESQQLALVAEEASKQANLRYAGALGAAAYGHYAEDPRLSLVLAAEATAKLQLSTEASAPTFDTRAAIISARITLANGGPFVLGSPIVSGGAMSIALNPQGTILAVGKVDGSIQFLEVATHAELQPDSQDHVGGIRDIEFSPDGKSLVSAGADGKLLLWQADSQGVWASKPLGFTNDVVPDVDFHPSGQFVMSANNDGTVSSWNLDGDPPQFDPFVTGLADVNTLAISKNGRFLVAGNADKSISGWDMQSGKRLMGPLEGVHSSHLLDIVFSSTGKSFFTMTTDGEAKRISFPEGKVLDTLFAANERVGALLLNASKGQLLAGNDSGQVVSWDLESRTVNQRSAVGHSQVIKHASMTRDERLIATLGRDQLIRFWTINDHYPMGQQMQLNSSEAKSVAISSDGDLIASGDTDGNINLWRLDSNDAPETFTGHGGEVWALDFSPDAKMLASADRLGKVALWDLMHRRAIQFIDTGKDPIWSVAFVNDDEVLIATDTKVSRYSVVDGKLLSTWDESSSTITRLSLSADRSKMLVTCSDGKVVIRNISGDEQVTEIDVSEELNWSASFNQSGTMLAVASSDETVTLIDTANGQHLAKLTGHRGGATNALFLGDGVTLVVSDRRGSIHWWDIETQRRLSAPWRGHKKTIWRMALHPDANRFATAGDDGKVWIWDTLSVRQACQIGFPGFDSGQKKQFLGDDYVLQACN